ncbi:glutaredoxin [Frigidibacter sp.]|uniref:glutaredoxin family protein n=1 Tax=Frigidibacter sp. TaxID=2586418 RepID=UPI002732452F|nr:glutaredoxin [Frigidibacter sp.]MDP3342336.1 glutaredoxin [Frigidibacter sp.]
MSHNHIELFTTPTCPDCAILKRWLEAQGLVYIERDLRIPGIAEEARRRTGLRIAPITIIDGKALWGPAADQVARLRPLIGVAHAY